MKTNCQDIDLSRIAATLNDGTPVTLGTLVDNVRYSKLQLDQQIAELLGGGPALERFGVRASTVLSGVADAVQHFAAGHPLNLRGNIQAAQRRHERALEGRAFVLKEQHEVWKTMLAGYALPGEIRTAARLTTSSPADLIILKSRFAETCELTGSDEFFTMFNALEDRYMFGTECRR